MQSQVSGVSLVSIFIFKTTIDEIFHLQGVDLVGKFEQIMKHRTNAQIVRHLKDLAGRTTSWTME